MSEKGVLWIDNDFINSIWGGRQGDDVERFNRVMDALAEEYDIKTTSVVRNEAVQFTESGDYASVRARAVDEWLTKQVVDENVEIVAIDRSTLADPNNNAGEQSLVRAIESDPNSYDPVTGEPNYKIASNDGYFNPEGAGGSYADQRVKSPTILEQAALDGHVGYDDYKEITELTPTLGWRDARDVMWEYAELLPEGSPLKQAIFEALQNWSDEALDMVVAGIKTTLKSIPIVGTAIAASILWPSVAEAANEGDVETVGEILTHFGIEEVAGDAAFIATVVKVWSTLGGGAQPTWQGKTIVAVISVGAGLAASIGVSEIAKEAFDEAVDQLQEWGFLPPDGTLNDLIAHETHGFAGIGAWLGGVLANFVLARITTSPLVLDLDGDGVELVALADSQTYWDLDQDGFGEKSGWVKADDGLLAIDANGDGKITDHSELFGSATQDGFADLRLLDSNNDNVINASDAAFADLLVWRDINQNGASEADELFSLADLDIVSINLNATPVYLTNAGHDISHVSTYTVDDGVSGPQVLSIVDVWFEYDDVNTQFAGDFTLDIAALFTANQRGYGELPDLYIAASMDNDLEDPGSLLSLLKAFSEKPLDELFADDGSIMDDVRAILFRWAGVDGTDPASRGAYVDARELAFLEAILGQGYQQGGSSANPGPAPSDILNEAFDMAENTLSARLMAQTAGKALFTGDVSYNPLTDSFDGITGFNQSALDVLLAKSLDPLAVTDKTAFWMQVINAVDQTVGIANLTSGELQKLNATLASSDLTLTADQVQERIQWALDMNYEAANAGDYLQGTTGNDVLVADASNDNLTGANGNDSLTGGLGNDVLSGGNGNDTLFGGLGNDLVNGGNGVDLYKFYAGQGHDILWESGPETDTLEFGAGITLADLEIGRISNTAVRIGILPSAGTGSITVEQGNLELLKFADNSTFDLRTINQTLVGTSGNDTLRGMLAGSMGTGSDILYGMDGDDTLYADAANESDVKVNWLHGGNGNDALYGDGGNDELWGDAGDDAIYGGATGNDTLTGGAGNDFVRGHSGNDTYVFNLGDGNDTLLEYSGTDKILFGAGITQADLSIYRISNRDVKIDIGGGAGGSITLQDQTYGTGQNYVTETLQFDDGSTLNLTTLNLTLNGTSAGETLSGVKVGGSGVDTIYGHGGNDTIYGYAGSFDALANTLYGGDGDDTIHGANGVDTIAGDDGNDTLWGYDGNDVIHGGAGNDTIGGGDNNDTIYGDDGADNLTGGNNNDTLIGGLGADTLTGSGGNDIFKFLSGQSLDAVDSITDFNTAYDKINIADLIDFDPLTHVITDFVQITTSGANSNLAVDTDGGGNNFIQIAVILNKTGLTDEAALLAGGQLIAA